MSALVCTWDWQAIAGFVSAGAIVWAALLARSTVQNFTRERYARRRQEVAEDCLALASSLVHAMLNLRTNAAMQVLNELSIQGHGAEVADLFNHLNVGDRAELESLETRARDLSDISFKCDMLFDKGVGDACRKIANSHSRLLASHKGFPHFAKLQSSTLVSTQLQDALAASKEQISIGYAPISGPDAFAENNRLSLSKIEGVLRNIVRAENAPRADRTQRDA